MWKKLSKDPLTLITTFYFIGVSLLVWVGHPFFTLVVLFSIVLHIAGGEMIDNKKLIADLKTVMWQEHSSTTELKHMAATAIEAIQAKHDAEVALRKQFQERMKAAETQLSAIRQAVLQAADGGLCGHITVNLNLKDWQAILNTTNAQPQCKCKNEHETVCDICAGGKEDSQPALGETK